MHRVVTMLAVTLVSCTRPLASLDDEAAESSESSTSETSTSESESTSDTSTSESEDDLGFIPFDQPEPRPDCDMILQNCPDGEKCIAYANDGGNVWSAQKCVPVTGDQHAGEPCHWGGIFEGTDDCDANSMCWDVIDVDGVLLGECVPFCTGTPDAPECPPAYSCVLANELSFCIAGCDPLLQDCGAGLGCFWANTNFSCIFTAGDIPIGEPCRNINDCAPGNFCTEMASLPACAGLTCCTKFCDLTIGDTQCVDLPGTTCVDFFDPGTAPAGYEDVGICVGQ